MKITMKFDKLIHVKGETLNTYVTNWLHAAPFKSRYNNFDLNSFEDHSFFECVVEKNINDEPYIVKYNLVTYLNRQYKVEYNLKYKTTKVTFIGAVKSYAQSQWWLDVLEVFRDAFKENAKIMEIEVCTHFLNYKKKEQFIINCFSTKNDFIEFKSKMEEIIDVMYEKDTITIFHHKNYNEPLYCDFEPYKIIKSLSNMIITPNEIYFTKSKYIAEKDINFNENENDKKYLFKEWCHPFLLRRKDKRKFKLIKFADHK